MLFVSFHAYYSLVCYVYDHPCLCLWSSLNPLLNSFYYQTQLYIPDMCFNQRSFTHATVVMTTVGIPVPRVLLNTNVACIMTQIVVDFVVCLDTIFLFKHHSFLSRKRELNLHNLRCKMRNEKSEPKEKKNTRVLGQFSSLLVV